MSPVCKKLKELREEAGLSVAKMGAALDMPAASYYHYETRYKRPHLPLDLAQKLIPIFTDKGIDRSRVEALAGQAVEPPNILAHESSDPDFAILYQVSMDIAFCLFEEMNEHEHDPQPEDLADVLVEAYQDTLNLENCEDYQRDRVIEKAHNIFRLAARRNKHKPSF